MKQRNIFSSPDKKYLKQKNLVIQRFILQKQKLVTLSKIKLNAVEDIFIHHLLGDMLSMHPFIKKNSTIFK